LECAVRRTVKEDPLGQGASPQPTAENRGKRDAKLAIEPDTRLASEG